MKMYIFCHSDAEASFIKSCLKSTWKTVPDLPVQFNLSHLLKLLSPLHRDRIERILASCLLYSSRYEDTKVMMSEEHPGLRMMMINLRNIPGSDPPIGKTSSGEDCCQLAILYHWTCPRTDSPSSIPLSGSTPGQNVRASRGRKISASLALEKKMLSIVDVFAVFPVSNL